jgi:hypothetical protein
MICDDPCRNTEETRPGPICRRWDEPHDRLRLWASRPADGVAEPETAADEPDTEQRKGVRPNHIGIAIARHKRAGRIEERDGKLYTTRSTATEQHAAV